MNAVVGDKPTLLHVFSTFAVGGPQTRFATIVNRLGPKYRHVIASMSGKTEAAELLSSDVDYTLVPVRNSGRNLLANILRYRGELSEERVGDRRNNKTDGAGSTITKL